MPFESEFERIFKKRSIKYKEKTLRNNTISNSNKNVNITVNNNNQNDYKIKLNKTKTNVNICPDKLNEESKEN